MASELPDGWREQVLYDIADYQNGRATKPAEVNTKAVGLPVIKIAELNRGITPKTNYVSESSVKPQHVLQDGDLLFAWSGTPGIHIYRGEKAALNQHIFKVTARKGIDQGFLRYLLESQMTVFERIVDDQKTTMGHVKIRDLKRLAVSVPPLAEQQAIAEMLGAIDDKIDVNTQLADRLDRLAATIFREWFVNFRFPGHENVPLVDSPLGPIPEGWEVSPLGQHVELAYGKALKADHRRGGDIPVLGSSGVVGWHDEGLVTGPGIVVGRKGNVGAVHWVDTDFYPIDTTFYVVSALPMHYLVHNLRQQNFINSDSAVPGLNRNQAYANPLLVPLSPVLQRFSEIVEPTARLVRELRNQNAKLRATRDLLLPRLLSGELRLVDAEKLAGEAL